MSNKQTTAFAPKLRFPEFKKADDWQPVPLNRLAIRTKEKNRDEKIVRVLTNSAEFGVMDQRDFFDKDIATQGNLESYYVVELGSYVYNPRISATAPVGPISKNKIGTGVMSPLYTVFKFNDENNEFYAHYFKTTGWHGYMRQASSTGARHDRMAISSEDFMAMPLPVSTPNELQKIADCLRPLDELIAAQGRKLETLKTHKKGLMQQLFPREGETQPLLRFPAFKEAARWRFVPLNSLVARTKQKNRDEKIVRVLTNSAEFGVMDQRDFFNKDIATQGNLESYYIVEIGSYVYNPRTSATAPVGPISKNKIGTGVMSPLYTVFKFKDESNDFYEHYFKTTGWHGYLRQTSSTGLRHDRMAISSEDFMAIPLPVSSPKEQQKIADCLSSLDELIAAQARKVEALKTHKKGLMQQLFPSTKAADV
jgi:type I restriction enzyme, S subunit